MRSSDLKNDLIDRIIGACKKHVEQIKIELADQVVFSYVIYCSAGCRNMGIALCTRHWLHLRNSETSILNEPVWYVEVNASEWNYVNKHLQLFAEVDDLINRLYDIFYDGQLEDVNLDDLDGDSLWIFISDFFVDAVVKSFTVLRNCGVFDNSIFESDILLGMQFGDPDQHSLKMIEQSSQKINAGEWHKKIQQKCDLIRKN